MKTKNGNIVRLSKDQHDALSVSYEHGSTTQAIADEYGISHTAVCGLLSRRGLLKNRSEAQRKYPIDERTFNVIDTEAKAYWLGFLAADGHVCGHELILQLSANDTEHLEKYRDWLSPTRPIQFVRRNNDGGLDARIAIKSGQMVTDLAHYGIVSQKTYKLVSRPLLANDLIRHYYRGYVDGDGYVGVSKRQRSKFQVLGTLPFLHELQEWLEQSSGITRTKIGFRHNMWHFEKNGEVQVAKIVELLYAGSSWYLERKYRAAINIHLAWKRPTEWASVSGAGVQTVEAPGSSYGVLHSNREENIDAESSRYRASKSFIG